MTTRDAAAWKSCPQGEWQRLSAGLLFRKWLLFARNAGIGLIAALGLAGGTWAAASQFRNGQETQLVAPCQPELLPCGTEKQDCDVDPNGKKNE